MTREIPLTRGMVALVDDEDYEAVTSLGKWYVNPHGHTFYARREGRQVDGKRKRFGLHNFLTGLPYVDHINGDGLDNRRQNLRQANPSTNQMNSRIRSDSTTGFKGVHRHRRKWAARIRIDGHRVHLGTFDSPDEAARVYDAAAREHFGEFARPNFQKVSA